MAQEPNLLGALSDLLVARFAAARDSVAALRLSERASSRRDPVAA